MRGLAESHGPHLLEVAKTVQKNWDEVSEMTICRCRIRSDVLPRPMSNELNAAYGRMRNTSRSDDIKAIADQLSKLSLGIDRRDSLDVQLQETVTEKDADYWLRPREQKEIQDALVHDDLNSITREEKNDQSTEEHVGNESDEDISMEEPLPSRAALMNQLDQLEKAAVSSQLDDAIIHLRRVRNAFREALRVDAQRSNRQLLVTEIMQHRAD